MTLTARERQVLSLYADTGSLAETARRLGLATQSVKNVLLACRKRTGAKNTAQLLYLLGAGEFDA